MTVTFQAAKQDGDCVRMLERCDCQERYCNECEQVDLKRERMYDEVGESSYIKNWNHIAALFPYPDTYHCDVCDNELNIANSNAVDLLAWLDLGTEQYGHINAKELAARCRRRLWDEPRNDNPAIEPTEFQPAGGPKVFVGGRRPNYLREMVQRLLKIAERAGDNLVAWS